MLCQHKFKYSQQDHCQMLTGQCTLQQSWAECAVLTEPGCPILRKLIGKKQGRQHVCRDLNISEQYEHLDCGQCAASGAFSSQRAMCNLWPRCCPLSRPRRPHQSYIWTLFLLFIKTAQLRSLVFPTSHVRDSHDLLVRKTISYFKFTLL